MSTAAAAPPFRLTRHFSLVSLVGVLMVVAGLLLFYRQHTTLHMAEQGGRANADVTQLAANLLWPHYRPLLKRPPGRDTAALRADPALPRLQAEVRQAMRGLPLVKLKIYDREGLTVFSTDPAQIGERKHDNAGFQGALGGRVVSEITHRNRFDAMEGVIVDRDLLASYVPVSSVPGAAPDAVFEVYADVTEHLQAEARALRLGAGIVLSLLGLLYLFLLATVRRADRLIVAQEQARAEQAAEVRHLAYHDGLTGLPNRRSFGERLAETLGAVSRRQQAAALMYIDLDRFKPVNDRLGHAAGDELLQVVASRLQACLAADDLLFRVGGDEFIAILPREGTPERADAVARAILAAVARPVVLQGEAVSVGASIGISLSPDDGTEAEALLRGADAAMYDAKARGRQRHAFHGRPVAADRLAAPVREARREAASLA